MGRDATRRARSLTVDRVFEPCRLGEQAMATSYATVVPIKAVRLLRGSDRPERVDARLSVPKRSEEQAG